MPRGAPRSVGRALPRKGPFVVVLAGPNGAGKSTFFELYLATLGIPFVNADRIARGLATESPAQAAYAAAAAADAERKRLVSEKTSFCTETVFSDPAGEKLAFLREAGGAGFAVVVVFVGLESPELCSARVAQRVAEGGHDVPDEKIGDRYPRTLDNLRAALPAADAVYLFDNSSCDEPYRFVASYRGGRLRRWDGPLPGWAEALPGLTHARRSTGRRPAGKAGRKPSAGRASPVRKAGRPR